MECLADMWRRAQPQLRTAPLSLRFAPEAEETRHRIREWGFQSRGKGLEGWRGKGKKYSNKLIPAGTQPSVDGV